MCTGRNSASPWIPSLVFQQFQTLTSVPGMPLSSFLTLPYLMFSSCNSIHVTIALFPTPWNSLLIFAFYNAFFSFYSDQTQHKKTLYNWKLICYHTFPGLCSQHVDAPRRAVQGLLQWHTQIRSKLSLSQVRGLFFLAHPLHCSV